MRKYVIGSNLSAIVYAFINEIPILLNDKVNFGPYEFLDKGVDYSRLYFFPLEREIVEDGTPTIKLMSKQLLAEHLLFIMSLNGLAPFGDSIQSLSIKEEEGEIRVACSNKQTHSIKFDKLTIFDDANVRGLDNPVNTINNNMVLVEDWFVTKSFSLDAEYLYNTKDHQMWFYEDLHSSRPHHDVLLLTKMKRSKSNKMKNLPSLYRIWVADFIEKSDVHDINRRFRIKATNRKKRDISTNIYKDKKDIKFNYMSYVDILKEEEIDFDSDMQRNLKRMHEGVIYYEG